jgi:inhibitor of KinA sporulation pathway (predicted exonuclease)
VDFLAVIDFEATCVAKPPIPPNPYLQEIIEFPIVLIDVAQQTIVRRFSSLLDYYI